MDFDENNCRAGTIQVMQACGNCGDQVRLTAIKPARLTCKNLHFTLDPEFALLYRQVNAGEQPKETRRLLLFLPEAHQPTTGTRVAV